MAGKPQLVDFSHPDFVQSIKRGDQSQWAQLYERMQTELNAYFRKQLPFCNEHEIDDYIIEVFSRAYAESQTFQAKSGLKSWLMNFAHFIARDTLKAVPQ